LTNEFGYDNIPKNEDTPPSLAWELNRPKGRGIRPPSNKRTRKLFFGNCFIDEIERTGKIIYEKTG
jgi:hypothetical protein